MLNISFYFKLQEFNKSVQFHNKRSKWKVVEQYERIVDSLSVLTGAGQTNATFLGKHLERFLRQFQLPNAERPRIKVRLNHPKSSRRMVLSDGFQDFYVAVSDKLATKLRSESVGTAVWHAG